MFDLIEDLDYISEQCIVLQEIALSRAIKPIPKSEYERMIRTSIVQRIARNNINKVYGVQDNDPTPISALGKFYYEDYYPSILNEEERLGASFSIEIEREVKQRLATYEAETDYLKKTSLDILIVAKGYDSFPILGIEYDGRVHQHPEQIKKDQLKNSICIQAHLPLVRITMKYLPEHQSYRYNNEDRLYREFRSGFIKFTCKRLALVGLDEEHLWCEHMAAIKKLDSMPEDERRLNEDVDWQSRWESLLRNHVEGNLLDKDRERGDLQSITGGNPKIYYQEDKDSCISATISLEGNRLGLPETNTLATPCAIKLSGAESSTVNFEHLTRIYIESYLLGIALDCCDEQWFCGKTKGAIEKTS